MLYTAFLMSLVQKEQKEQKADFNLNISGELIPLGR